MVKDLINYCKTLYKEKLRRIEESLVLMKQVFYRNSCYVIVDLEEEKGMK